MSWRRVVGGVLVLAGCTLMHVNTYAEDTGDRLVADAVTYRKKLSRLYLELRVRAHGVSGSEGNVCTQHLKLWNDIAGDRFRCDRLVQIGDLPAEARRVSCWQCGYDGLFLEYSGSSTSAHAVAVFGQEIRNRQELPNGQLLGMLPTGFRQLGTVDIAACGFIARLMTGNSRKLSDDDVGRLKLPATDLPVLRAIERISRVRHNTPDGSDLGAGEIRELGVCDLSKGGSFIYVEATYDQPHGSVSDRSWSTLRQWNDVWYPERVVSERYQEGMLVDSEEVRVLHAEFNADRRFTRMSDLDLEKGSLVIGAPGHEGSFSWDGQAIVPVAASPLYSETGEPFGALQSRFWSPWLILNLGVVSVLVACLLLRALWRPAKE